MTASPPLIVVGPADWNDPRHQAAVLELLDLYAQDPMGGGRPLSNAVRQSLIPALAGHPAGRAFLAWQGDQAVGLALCFLGFSTFQALPLLNLHDLAVRPGHRGQGIGRALLAAVEADARALGCCKITLEVRADNTVARALYLRFGFDPGDPASDAMAFWTKTLVPSDR